jgi:mRNA interferase RelE/StbE
LPPGGSYSITFARSARRELERIPLRIADVVLRHIEALENEPRPPGVKKIHGAINVWRLRVGDYRVIYTIDDATRVVDVSAIRDRKDAYR